MRRVIVASLLLITTIACTDTGSNSDQASDSDSSRCLNVPAALSQAIGEGITFDGPGTRSGAVRTDEAKTGDGSVRNAAAVKSNDYENAYFISADIQGPGLEGPDDVATFVTNRLSGTDFGIIMAADQVAKDFSVFPDAAKTDFEISFTDDGGEEARSCVSAS